MELQIIIIVAYILMAAAFLSVLLISVLDGQRSQRRQMRRLKKDIAELNNRLKSPEERRAEAAQREAVEAENQRIRDLYEYGGC